MINITKIIKITDKFIVSHRILTFEKIDLGLNPKLVVAHFGTDCVAT